MSRYHGVTDDTFKRIVVDSGAVYLNFGKGKKTITLASVIATDAIVVNGTSFVAVASGATGNQFAIGASDSETATNLAAKIDALANITATASGAVVTVTAETEFYTVTITTSDTTFTIATVVENSVLLGATRGGNTFTIETEYKDIGFDGQRGPTKGARRITNVNAKMAVNLLEITTDVIKMALPGSSSVAYPASPGTATHDQITRALQLALTDYKQNVTLIGTVGDLTQPIILQIKNPIVDGNFELAATDKEEAVLALQFTGHFDPSDLDTEPWEIRRPLEA